MNEKRRKRGWRQVKFGEVVNLNRERISDPESEGIKRYIGLEHITPEDLKIRDWGYVSEGTSFTNYFKPGQVLFGKRRAYQRKVAIADFDGVCSSDIYTFESKDSKILLPDLLPFICQTEDFYNYAVNTSAGSLSPRTNWRHLQKYEFALPSLDEQQAITDLLVKIENELEALFNCLVSDKQLFNSTLHHLFSEDIKEKAAKLGDISTKMTNGFVGSAAKYYIDEGVPYLRSTNIRRNLIDTKDLIHVTEKFHKRHQKSILQEGDLLTVQSGHVGETAVVPVEYSGWNCHALIITRLKKDKLLPEYASLFLNSILGQWILYKYFVGSTILHINTSDLAKVKVPCPSMNRQEYVVKLGNRLLDTGNAIQDKLRQTEDLKKSILAIL